MWNAFAGVVGFALFALLLLPVQYVTGLPTWMVAVYAIAVFFLPPYVAAVLATWGRS